MRVPLMVDSMPKVRKAPSLWGLLTRAMTRGTAKRFLAT